jgi:transcriptional regulator with XRE-family HTH domain
MIEKHITIKISARTESTLQGRVIEVLRKSKGWSQQKLGDELGVSRPTIQSWERDGIPKQTFLPAVAQTLGVEIEVLVVG